MERQIDSIEILGASENNLKHIDVTIPKGRLVVFAGVSGSGKSSLAFDTLAVEANREWQQSYPLFLRNKMPHYDRPRVDEIRNLTPAIAVDQKAVGATARSTVGTAVDVAPLLRLLFSRVGEPSAGGSMAYNFNHPEGMYPDCTGIGERLELIEESLFDPDRSLAEGAILFSQFSAGWQTHLYQNNPLLDANKKLRDFSPQEWDTLKYGAKEQVKVGIRSNNTGRVDMVEYEGVLPRFERVYLKRDITKLKKSLQDEIMSHVRHSICASCGGSGLNPKALASRINGKNIMDCMNMTAADLLAFLEHLTDLRGASLARQIGAYLRRMIDVGIGYLSLSRKTETLSGGEVQRVKLASELHKRGQVYVLNEPSTGLHASDVEALLALLRKLVADGNTVVMVEHRLELIAQADWIIDMGPDGGTGGGEVVFEGTPEQLIGCEASKTGRFLSQSACRAVVDDLSHRFPHGG